MRPVPSRRLVSAAAAASAAVVPVLVAALAAGVGPLPGAEESPTVRAVATNGPLGFVEDDHDGFDGLDGAHPVTRPTGIGVTIRPAATRDGAAGPDVSDTALPARVLGAYKNAAASLGRSDPGCRLTWPLLAGIGKVESGHAAGGAVDRTGDTLFPILGPVLDGSPGVAAIPDTDDGRWDTDRAWDRAVGPMQFIPSSWQIHGADGNEDGDRDPNNVVDASLASAGYLCTGDRDLTTTKDRRAAVFSYNHSWDYVDLVLAWAEAYAGGTPVLTGTLLAAGERSGGDGARSRDGSPGDLPERAPAPGTVSATSEPPASRPAPPPAPAPSKEPTGPAADGPSQHPSTAPASPSAEPTGSPSPSCPSGDPSPTGSPTGGPTTPEPSPTPTSTPEPSGSATPQPTPSGSPDPCGEATPTPSAAP